MKTNLLVTEYLEDIALYIAEPIIAGRRGPEESIFMFDTEDEMSRFINDWFINPCCAAFAYHVMKERAVLHEALSLLCEA